MGWFGWRRRRGGRIRELEAAPAALIAGRVRAVGVPYLLPRDMEEVNRLDFQHYVLRYAFQGLYAAPLRNPRDIVPWMWAPAPGAGRVRWRSSSPAPGWLASTSPCAAAEALTVRLIRR